MEDWGPRSPANPIPFPRRGRGLPPDGQQGAPRQHVNRQQVRSLAPFGTLSHAPLPQGPIRLAVGPRTCRPPPPPPSPGPPAAISCPASRNQRSSVPGPRNAGPTVPIRLKASALAVAVHWTLRHCHLRLSRRCVGRWCWFAFCFQLPRVTLAVCPLLGWPSDNTRSSPELSVRTCSVCRVSG